MDLAAALAESWNGVTDFLSGLEPSEWELPTPCEGWTVRDVAAHLGHVEGLAHEFPQPPTPDDFDPSAFAGFHAFTEEGVAARRGLAVSAVYDEVLRASRATLQLVDGYRPEDWMQPVPSPVGTVPARRAAEIRIADVQVHLFDMRTALGREPSQLHEPTACSVLVDRAVRLSGWGAVKGAGLPDGTRIRLEIEGRSPADLVVEERRGRLVDPVGGTHDRISGSGLAFALAAAGRATMAESAGGLTVEGEAARALLAGYRLFL